LLCWLRLVPRGRRRKWLPANHPCYDIGREVYDREDLLGTRNATARVVARSAVVNLGHEIVRLCRNGNSVITAP